MQIAGSLKLQFRAIHLMGADSLDYGKIAFDAVDDIEIQKTPEDVVQALGDALSIFGYSSFLIADAPETALQVKPRFLLNGWPMDWTRTYLEENLYACDPIAAHLRRSVYPFEWAEVRLDTRRDKRAAEVMERARSFKLHDGFVVPIFRDQPSASCVTMAGDGVDCSPHAKRALYLISLYAHAKAVSLLDDEEPNPSDDMLTNGEREALVWTAVGKSAWEISIILNISEPTVVWRLKQAQRKLRASNKVQTVVNALRTRQISI